MRRTQGAVNMSQKIEPYICSRHVRHKVPLFVTIAASLICVINNVKQIDNSITPTRNCSIDFNVRCEFK